MNIWQHIFASIFAAAFLLFAVFFVEYMTMGKLKVYRLIIGSIMVILTVTMSIFCIVLQFTGLPQ